MAAATIASMAETPIVELVRRRPQAAMVLADLGISPRYLYWTVEAAAADLSLELATVLRQLNVLAHTLSAA